MEWFKGHSWETLWFPLDVPGKTNPLQDGKPLRKKSGTHVGNYVYKKWTHVGQIATSGGDLSCKNCWFYG